MSKHSERRASKRFCLTLPLTVHSNTSGGVRKEQCRTRDVSFRGLYFLTDGEFQPGMAIEFVLTLPAEITQAGDLSIRCYGQVLRAESHQESRGIAARIERYEFLETSL